VKSKRGGKGGPDSQREAEKDWGVSGALTLSVSRHLCRNKGV